MPGKHWAKSNLIIAIDDPFQSFEHPCVSKSPLAQTREIEIMKIKPTAFTITSQLNYDTYIKCV